MTTEEVRVIRHWQRIWTSFHEEAKRTTDASTLLLSFYHGRVLAVQTLIDVLHVPEDSDA